MRRPRTPPTPERPPDWAFPVACAAHVRRLGEFVRGLREDSPHGNRTLFLDDVFVAHLLAFFNPCMQSLRKLEDFSQTRQAARNLNTPRIPRSTLSDYHRFADFGRLEPLADALRSELDRGLPADVAGPDGRPVDGDLLGLLRRVEARDGTFLTVAADVAWALKMHRPAARGQPGREGRRVRFDVSMHAGSWVPEVVAVHGDEATEAEQAASVVRPGVVYVYDRGIFSFDLVEKQLAAGADFVHRMRKPGERTPKLAVVHEEGLSDEDRLAGVLADRRGTLAGSQHRRPPAVTLREIVVSSPDQPDREVRLLTSLLDVPAWAVALIYRWRWQVELFFRWLKVYAGFDHLISHSRPGVEIAVYTAVIGTLLVCLQSGGRPSTHAFSLLTLVAGGGATLEEIAPILRERERQSALDRASKARRAAKKKS